MANNNRKKLWGEPVKEKTFRIPQNPEKREIITDNVYKLLEHCKGMTPEELREFEFKFCNEKQYEAMCKVAEQGNLNNKK